MTLLSILVFLLVPSVCVASAVGGVWGVIAGVALGACLSVGWSYGAVLYLERARERLDRGHRRQARSFLGLPLALDRTVHRIEADNNRMRTVLSAIRDGVLALDEMGRIILLNRAARQILELEGGRGREDRLIDLRPEFEAFVDAALSHHVEQRSEIAVGERLLEVGSVVVKEPTTAVLVIHDITEKRSLETMRRDFVANVSHELKTPLSAIRAYVETLIDGGLEDPTVNLRFTKKIESNALRLSTLITDLLTLSRIETGRMVGQRQALALQPLLADCTAAFSDVCDRKGIELSVAAPEDSLMVLGDSEALHQVFDNLISNALKYTERDGEIGLEARREGAHVLVSVHDTGIGIPMDDLPRVFERFYRVDKARSREQGGTGLGLSIVKHYVEALDGEIEVESEPGVGSTFKVRLPAA